jgi:hypothetical protein
MNQSTKRKSPILGDADRKVVQDIVEVMMELNRRDNLDACYDSTYGKLREALLMFIYNATGVNHIEPDFGCYATYADDIQAAITEAYFPKI